MNLADVMDEVAGRLATIDGLRAYAFLIDSATPPFAVTAWPETYEYDATYGRGSDTVTLPVIVAVGRVSDRASRGEMAAYADGSGPRSVKAVLESGTYSALDSLRVANAEFNTMTLAGVEHLSATFNVDIIGQGA